MSDYSLVAKALHHMALNSPLLGEAAFDIERSLFLKSSPQPSRQKHVFISGLARAGTTILMREVYRTGLFASLIYKDMPFVLSPNVWKSISHIFSKQRVAKERAHGDGILVDFDSPEALDEVFWRSLARCAYIKSDGLYPHTPDEDMLHSFRDYIRLVLRCRKKARYLSKNNNNILRISALHKCFPDAVFLLPVREPLVQAQSLLSQHRRFLDSDRFTKKYMNWLGHHEFGATHRPFVLSSASYRFSDTSTLEYWLEQWIRCYSYLDRFVQNSKKRVYFVPYESLCRLPVIWQRIAGLIDVDVKDQTEFRVIDRPVKGIFEPELVRTANDLYQSISRRALERLGVESSTVKGH